MVIALLLSIPTLSAIGATDARGTPPLKYDSSHDLRWGYNDLNHDGIPDTLIIIWNGKTIAFVSDDGKLPWSTTDEGRDWNAYFNKAFNVGKEPPQTWSEMRAHWGNYTILVDRDDCGRFDSQSDFYYKALDLNGDGAPEAEYYHLFPGTMPWSNKLHFNLSGERDMSFLNWATFFYDDEQRYLPGGKYIMNVHGNGFFLNSYSSQTQHAWENPIAWYDFDFDGRTNMVMRAADTHQTPAEVDVNQPYRGDLSEFEMAFELNGNTSKNRWHSLDMQITYYQYDGVGPSYRNYVDEISKIKGLPEARFLSEKLLSTRQEPIRKYFPYMDGYKIGAEFDGWAGVWMIFDEDDDDCRWEEMFGKHESWVQYSDRIGDRIEVDSDFGGKGKLYVGKFDGRIHLYHAEQAFWDIDYLSLYKGSIDRPNTPEGPEPPKGLRYPRVRYSDTNRNGFIDTIEYMTVEYGNEENSAKIERAISLIDLCGEIDRPDICELIDPRVDAKISDWRIKTWDGQPLTESDFEGTSAKMAYDKYKAVYSEAANNIWKQAKKLHAVAKELGLNKSENSDTKLKIDYTKEELAQMKELTVPAGYSRHLKARGLRDKYNNGFWLREKTFADIIAHSGLDRKQLERFYYTGRIDDLCKFIRTALKK